MADRPAAHQYSSEELLQFMDRFMENEDDLRKLKFIWRESGIDQKYSALDDFKIHGIGELFGADRGLPTTTSRMKAYARHAPDLAEQVIRIALDDIDCPVEEIDHIITVSCTGLSAPGLEIELSQRLDLRADVNRHGINFMGCYAAFHGMRLADLILKAHPKDTVLLVCVELCSLHFKPGGSVDNLLSTALFADGAAAMVLGSGRKECMGQIHGFHSALIPSGKDDMAWNVGEAGFDMVLNKRVPKHIEQNMASAYMATLDGAGLSSDDVGGFAIHPGGKNILKAFAHALGQEEEALSASYEVLKSYGNMSSGTVLFVLRRLLERKNSAKSIFAAAFGPGLSVESAVITPMTSGYGEV